MTRLTQSIIANDPEVYAGCYGTNEEGFGLYVGTFSESPSGCKRPRALLASEKDYTTEEEATAAAQELIDLARKVTRG